MPGISAGAIGIPFSKGGVAVEAPSGLSAIVVSDTRFDLLSLTLFTMFALDLTGTSSEPQS